MNRCAFGWLPILATLSAAACASGCGPYHFAVVEPGVLYRSGQVRKDSLEEIHEQCGIRTIVDLVAERRGSPFVAAEGEFAREKGIRYIHLPIPPVSMGVENFAQWLPPFFEILDDHRNHPVLVHCWKGIKRTGVMVAIYRMEYQRWDNAEALRGLSAFGRTPEDFTLAEREFILNYVPRWKRKPVAPGGSDARPASPASPAPR